MDPGQRDRRSRGDSPHFPPGPSSRESTSGVLVVLALLLVVAALAYYRHWDARQDRELRPPAPVVEVVLRG